MTQEEKARAYDEAVKEASIAYKDEDKHLKATLERIFPELKESEDERMRKEIIQTLKRYAKCVEDGHDAPSAKDFVIREVESQITWLEKQGEQKNYSWKPTEEQFEALDYAYNSCPDTERGNYYEGILETLIEDLHRLEKQSERKPADKVEPKFREGDWITDNKNELLQVTKFEVDYGYELKAIYGRIFHFISPDFVYTNYHRWTIEDAKDGDVLIASDESIFIYAGSTDRHANFYLALTKCGKLNVDGGNWEDKNSVHPATKEQRDTLFAKIKEAGYEWDAEKKKLKKIDDEEVNGEDYGIDGFWHAQRILEKTLGSVDGYQTDDGILDHKAAITAVKKLYKQKPTWSEEDERERKRIIELLEGWLSTFKETCYAEDCKCGIVWLKSLKERIGE